MNDLERIHAYRLFDATKRAIGEIAQNPCPGAVNWASLRPVGVQLVEEIGTGGGDENRFWVVLVEEANSPELEKAIHERLTAAGLAKELPVEVRTEW